MTALPHLGPWEIRRQSNVIGRVNGPAIFDLNGVNPPEAWLAAAAPELLEALEALIDGFPLPMTANEYELVQAGCDPTEARKIARAVTVIAKARGGA